MTDPSGAETILIVLSYLLAFVFMVWLWVFVPAKMAKNRNRGAVVWVLISFVGSPLLAILLLYALGEASPFEANENQKN